MKRLLRFLVLAVTLVIGLTTVSAQTVQVLLTPKVPSLPSTVTSYLDDPFHYFNVQFVVNGAPSDGIDVFFDMEFSVNTAPFYVRTRPGSLPMLPIHLREGVNRMTTDILHTQVVNRAETNFDYSNPLNALQLPEGTYELCLDIYNWNDPERANNLTIGMCPTFDICYSGTAPELVTPLAGAQIAMNGMQVVTPVRKVTFFWNNVISNCATNNTRFKYQLKMVKVLDGQNYQDAIRLNPTVFITEVPNKNFAVLDTLLDVKIQLERGALYVAQVHAEQLNNLDQTFNIANDGNSQPMPFYWGFNDHFTDPTTVINNNSNFPNKPGVTPRNRFSRKYGFVVDDESEEGEISEGVEGLTVWDGGVEEVSELETIINEMQGQQFVGFSPKRHYVASDGYYTIPMTDNIDVRFMPAKHKALKNVSYAIEVYEYMDGGVDSITAYEPLCSAYLENVPDRYSLMDNHELISQTLDSCGTLLEEGNLYYLQLASYFTVGYWNYMIADTSFYVNDMLAEHIHDTISREFVEEELMYPDGIYFQWGNDPNVPDVTTPQWKAPVNRSSDDIYDPANHMLPISIKEVQKTGSFPVSWTPVKSLVKGDVEEFEVNVYELKSGQTLKEAVALNPVLVTRTVTSAHEIAANDAAFFKVFSPGKTYIMTLATNVQSESNFYHFENGNEALPIVFKIVK